jgi:hypothetical protein
MFDSIDWSRPWLRSVRDAHESVDVSLDWKKSLNHCATEMKVCNELGKPIRFVEPEALPQGVSYEAYIHETGQVPTRGNLHDYFNALVWLSFPSIKCRLNALQAAQIKRDGITAARGGARDAATVFDENAALIVVRESDFGMRLIELLRGHEWRQLFFTHRDGFFEHCDIWLFGHALMEKLVNPYKAITAHAWHVVAADNYFSMNDSDRQNWLDQHVASQLQQCRDGGLSTTSFMPLPVLGVPGWWPSQDERFYADQQVFRPKRLRG